MYLIDAVKNLKRPNIKELIDKAGGEQIDSILIFDKYDDKMFTSKLADIRKNYFENAEIAALVTDRNDIITIIANDIALRMSGDDYFWWTASVRKKPFGRLYQLFEDEIIIKDNRTEAERNEQARMTLIKPKKENTQTYKCACGIKVDNNIKDIETFEGNEKQMRDFVNKLFARNTLRSFGKALIVYCVNYQDNDDLNHIENWKTITQLTNEGVFKK